MLTYNPPPHMDAAALIRRADALMNRWAEKYGLHDPKWLPPAGVVQWQEDAARYLAAHTLPAPTHGVTVVQPQQEAELDAEIDKAWQQWSVAGNVMYRQGFINAVNSLARDADGVTVLPGQQWQGLTKAEIDHAVGELVEYGTDFVAPLYSVVEGIERKLRQRNDGVPVLPGQQQHVEVGPLASVIHATRTLEAEMDAGWSLAAKEALRGLRHGLDMLTPEEPGK